MCDLKLLFVDDEENILQALRRMLHPHRKEWAMTFCTSGSEALDVLQRESFDLIVTDIRMPKVDGSRVLFESYLYHPEMIRCVLSGYAERNQAVKVSGTAHQFLSKPCSREVIEQTVQRAHLLKTRLPNQQLRQAISRLSSIPCHPGRLKDLMNELNKDQPDPETVALIVASDASMSGKVIQLVTSSFFGRSSPVYDPVHAVNLLGIELLASLVHEMGIFTPFEQPDCGLDMDHTFQSAHAIAIQARQTAIDEGRLQQADKAYLTGLLHSLGRICLAYQFPGEYRRIAQVCHQDGCSMQEAERRVLGTPSTEVAAFLLAIWGLPQEIVDSVNQFDESLYESKSPIRCDKNDSRRNEGQRPARTSLSPLLVTPQSNFDGRYS